MRILHEDSCTVVSLGDDGFSIHMEAKFDDGRRGAKLTVTPTAGLLVGMVLDEGGFTVEYENCLMSPAKLRLMPDRVVAKIR